MNWQILLIDDSPKIHTLIKAMLAKEPVDVHTATDPRYGLVLAASVRPDLILLDVDMPEMDGFEAARHLKSDPASADCPLIFLTSHSDTAEKVKGFGLGAVDYVTKPFNAAELCMRVRASLVTRRTIRQLEDAALIDQLTGLGNRAMFDRRLDAEVRLRAKSEQPLAVVAVAIDDHDAIEPRYGLATARHVTKHIGAAIREACRPEDVACRLDGPTFAALMPHVGEPEALAVAERIRAVGARLRFQPPAPRADAPPLPVLTVTLRTGVAVATEPYDRSLLDRAQAAMAEPARRAA